MQNESLIGLRMGREVQVLELEVAYCQVPISQQEVIGASFVFQKALFLLGVVELHLNWIGVVKMVEEVVGQLIDLC